MFIVQSLDKILDDDTLSLKDKQVVIILYKQMMERARCDITEKKISKITGINESDIHKTLDTLREKEYLVGPNMAL